MNINKQSLRQLSPAEKNQVKQMIRSLEPKEAKCHDIVFNLTSLDTTGLIINLTSITQGTAINQRVGASVRPKKLECFLSLVSSDATNILRMTFFRYVTNTSLANPTGSALYAAGLSGIPTCLTPLSTNSFKSYKVLKDLLYCTAANSETFNLNVSKDCNSVPLGFETRYNSGLNTGENHVFLALSSDSNLATHPALYGVIRVWYEDSD